ncbi:MAG: LysR family transcriptional regulator [Burkholderiales bacterium]
MMNVLALTDFNLVAVHGGFGRAARASGRPKATLSRHVLDLESSLGVRLLERAGRSFKLTDEGKLLYARTERPLSEIGEVAHELVARQASPRGRLRVSSTVTFGHASMGRLAAEFARRYPEVQLEVTVEDRLVDLIEEGYDAVIRVNPRPDNELVGRCFQRDQLLIVAPPSLPRPVNDADSTSAPTVPAVVGVYTAAVDKWTAVDGASELSFRRHAVLRLPSPLMVRDAVLAGAGAAILASNFVAADVAAGRMNCWGTVPNRWAEVWVMHTSRRLTSRKVAAFVQFLCESANQQP